MQARVHWLRWRIALFALLLGAAQVSWGQTEPAASPAAGTTLPDAPTPAAQLASSQLTQDQAQQPTSTQQTQQPASPQQTPPPAPPPVGQSSSNPQSSTQPPPPEKTQREKAEEEVREQEHQRVAGIVPSFNVTYRADAVSLTAKQKFELQFHAAIDPYTFALAAVVAGLDEAEDNNTGFGWGPLGYTKRFAAEYADNVIGNTLGNALLPSILHQDPRYFRLGHGSPTHRILYAFATTWVCKHDNTGKWEPNYSNVLGNMIAGEISNLYYPEQKGKNDTVQAIENGLTVTFEGSFGGELQEWWPDISRKLFHKDPTHGLDAQARANDAAAKLKKQQEKNRKQQEKGQQQPQ